MTLNETKVDLVSEGSPLDCWTLIPEEPRGVAVLLHGLPAAQPDPDDPTYAVLARSFAERGWACLWPDMRGARGSGGYFSLGGWIADGLAAVRKARGLAQGPLALVGNSAGGVVATNVALEEPPDALVLIATPAVFISFDDPSTAIWYINSFTGMPLAPDVQADPTAWSKEFVDHAARDAIGKIQAPIFAIHGTADDVVAVEHAHMLAEAQPAAELTIVDGADHRLRHRPDVVEKILLWLDDRFPLDIKA